MKTKYTLGALALVAMTGLSGCMSMQSGTTLDQISGVISSKEPFVEAYFEYPGPNERWAGPKSFVLHVDAKDGETAKVEVLSKTTDSPFELSSQRTLASETTLKKVPRDVARDLLANFATSLSETTPEFVGCVHPVRVRMTKNNGALIEKQGCRGAGQWTRAASELVAYLVTTERYGYNESTVPKLENKPDNKVEVKQELRADAKTPATEVKVEVAKTEVAKTEVKESAEAVRVPASVQPTVQTEETAAQKNLKVEIERVPTGTDAVAGTRDLASQAAGHSEKPGDKVEHAEKVVTPEPSAHGESSEHGAHGETKSPH